jgi:hypothetical protein
MAKPVNFSFEVSAVHCHRADSTVEKNFPIRRIHRISVFRPTERLFNNPRPVDSHSDSRLTASSHKRSSTL